MRWPRGSSTVWFASSCPSPSRKTESSSITFELTMRPRSILNGLAAVGTTSKADEIPRVLSGISVPPRKSMTISASAEVVKTLSLKQGVKLVALDLSAL